MGLRRESAAADARLPNSVVRANIRLAAITGGLVNVLFAGSIEVSRQMSSKNRGPVCHKELFERLIDVGGEFCLCVYTAAADAHTAVRQESPPRKTTLHPPNDNGYMRMPICCLCKVHSLQSVVVSR